MSKLIGGMWEFYVYVSEIYMGEIFIRVCLEEMVFEFSNWDGFFFGLNIV